MIEPKDLIDDITAGSALRDRFFGESRKQLLEHLASPSKQAVRMPSLRNALPGLIRIGKRIAFDYGHFAVVIGQGPSRLAGRPCSRR